MKDRKYLLLDVDNTLYPKSSGLDKLLRNRIIRYLSEKHGLTLKEAEEARERYVRKYGLSLPGIMEDFDVDVGEYQEYIHDVDLARYIKPNPVLASILDDLPYEKVLYTNSSEYHTRRVIDALGLDGGIFTKIVDFRSTGCRAKPLKDGFQAMLDLVGAKGGECIMVDDMPKTISVAKLDFGMGTVLVDEDGLIRLNEADWHISEINQLGVIYSAEAV